MKSLAHSAFYIFLSLGLFACQKWVGIPAELSAAPKIRYEAVNEQGLFVTKTEFTDHQQAPADPKALAELEKLAAQSQSLLAKAVDGNETNKIHVVFIGDGYTQNELVQFAQDVETNKKIFLSQQPFKAYEQHFIFHRVDIPSEVSLSSLSPAQVTSPHKTAFGMYFGCHGIDRLLCVDTNKILAAIKKIPRVDATFVLANSDRYGGAGYMDPPMATLSARNPAATELALHEFGHSFANLTDEYETPGPTADCNQYPNSSKYEKARMQSDQLKWYRWLTLSHVGTFTGSCYGSNNFRPTQNSKMRSLGSSYEEVNIEQFIFKFYQKISLLNSFSPLNDKTLKGHQVLSLSTLDPAETALQIQWSINNQVMNSLNNMKEIRTDRLNLKKGTFTFSVKIIDPTPRVRDEKFRSEKMSKSIRWKIKIP